MRYTVSLKENSDFRRLYSAGKSSVNACLAVYCRKNRLKCNRLGITVGSKVGKAVVRNRVRRRIREAYRLHEPEMACGYDIVVVARVRAAHEDYAALCRALLSLLVRLHIRKE